MRITRLTFKGNRPFVQLRTHPRVQADLRRRAQSVAATLGEGWEAVDTEAPRNRARSAVVATNGAARRRAAESPESVINALGAGRD
jgi:hypothetical protein